MLIDCKDRILINYIENELKSLNIEYKKQWKSKYNIDFILDYGPLFTNGFYIMYDCKHFKELHYINKITKELITNREHLEKCLCLK